MKNVRKTALITGASAGLGASLARSLADRDYNLVLIARGAERLYAAAESLALSPDRLLVVSGDVRDEVLHVQLAERIERLGWRVDLVVNNASRLGPSPLPPLLELPQEEAHAIYHTNSIAPLALLQRLRPRLRNPMIVNVSSDAATGHYPGWGGYGSAKAALDHWSAVLAAERPDWKVYAFDPGDMRTAMHQAAFPGEDISDRPLPEQIALPALLHLIDARPDSGRYLAAQLQTAPDHA